ncbi:MAG: hypothetical protein OEY06_03970 [Gammaproteobacteria bacterium]|nr:hypothetical protein [Gammaproteobacteria bacterium]
MKIKVIILASVWLCVFFSAVTQATTLDDIGFTDLKLELGVALHDGAGVNVTQVEAPVSGAWIPDIASAQFTSKIFNEISIGSIGYSNHATSVGYRFYGLTVSSSPGISNIDLFEAGDWLGTGFLNTGAIQGPFPKTIEASIGTSSTRIVNHSWAGSYAASGWAGEILRRIDYLVEVDEFIQVVGVSVNTTTYETPSNSFNAIVAGISAGTGTTGTRAIDTTYVSARAKPDVVAPESAGSYAAPNVSSAAALLIDYAHSDPLLSNGSAIINSNTVYNAERSETIKALLMAGADRATVGNTNAVDITDYRVAGKQTSNGLDTRFGAGQINIYNSYHVLAVGEQDSAEDGGSVFADIGFDYDPSFGGLSGNSAATYSFTTSAIGGQQLKAALVWNLDVLTTSTDNLYNLDLQLIDVTGGNVIIASSTSIIDNTENIWVNLKSNNDYQLKVITGAGQAAFEWDYALAWQTIVVPGITVAETVGDTVTAEDGTTDIFTLVLDTAPIDDVVINLSSSDTSEATVSPSSVTFTSSNWSTLQTVIVTGVNDAVDDGDINYNINFSVSSVADANYNGMTLSSVIATNTDDDATFSFTNQSNVALNTLTTSNAVVITGLLTSSVISITGGEYSIGGGAYTSADGIIDNGNNVMVQTTSPTTGLTSVNVILSIGDVSDTFMITTEVDTDGDGLGNSIDIDDDNDGLTDTDELTLGTNPLVIDTDNDGFTDGEEVLAGSDPLDVNSLPVFSDADINNDGLVNMVDIILAQQIIMGNIGLTSTYLAHGDVAPLVNGIPAPDGLFTLGDLVVMQRKMLGETTF